MLKVCGHFILNLRDIQKYCNPWQILNQREAFCSFAEVHCVPLPLILWTKEGEGKRSKWIKKEFWDFLLLESSINMKEPFNKMKASDMDGDCIVRLCIQYHERLRKKQILKEEFMLDVVDWDQPWERIVDLCIEQEKKSIEGTDSEADIPEIRERLEIRISEKETEQIKEEAVLADIGAKIKDIQSSIPSCTDVSGWLLVELLAICILLEVEPEKVLRETKEAPASRQLPDSIHDTAACQEQKGVQLLDVPEKKVIQLMSSRKPYRFLLYEDDTLPQKGRIDTVRIEAIHSKNEFEKVTIQLFSEKEQKNVWEFTMNNGEYRHCNVVEGKIVKFLPTMSISSDRCIYRPHYNSSDIWIRNSGSMEELILEYGENVSCFSTCEEGELFICGGRLITSRYQPYRQNPNIANKLDAMDVEHFVEVCVTDQGYMLLNEDGIIRSNIARQNGRENVVSLSAADWKQGLQGVEEVKEFCVNEKRDCVILHMIKKDECRIYWSGEVFIRTLEGNVLNVIL